MGQVREIADFDFHGGGGRGRRGRGEGRREKREKQQRGHPAGGTHRRFTLRFFTRSSKLILVFSREAYEPGQSLSVRVFADFYGIAEDAVDEDDHAVVTGAAADSFACRDFQNQKPPATDSEWGV